MLYSASLNLAQTAATTCENRAERLAEQAYWALEQEATLSPKPALVDNRSSGAHQDMNIELMLTSARTLQPYFAAMAEAAMALPIGIGLRQEIGRIGREAEAAMLEATGGVNTHRGAIWALGLLIAAAVRTREPITLMEQAGRLAQLPDSSTITNAATSNGQRACAEFKVPGAREQAQMGFPQVRLQGLPALQHSRASGHSEASARLNSLLAIMSGLTDTCVLSRAGRTGLDAMQRGAAAVLAAGGVATFNGRRALRQLEQRLLSLNASPGGAADLLAATLFVDRLTAIPKPVRNPSNNN